MKNWGYCAEEIQGMVLRFKHCDTYLGAKLLQNILGAKATTKLVNLIFTALLILMALIGVSCTSGSLDEDKIVSSVRKHYGYTEIDYDVKVLKIVSSKDYVVMDNSTSEADKVALVEVYHLPSSRRWTTKFGRIEKTSKWAVTISTNRKELDEVLRVLEDIRDSQ